MPRKARALQDTSFLNAALEGLELQRRRIEEQIEQVRTMFGRRRVRLAAGGLVVRAATKRQLSPKARKRIAEAQKRRWAEYRTKQAAQAKED